MNEDYLFKKYKYEKQALMKLKLEFRKVSQLIRKVGSTLFSFCKAFLICIYKTLLPQII